MAKFMYGGGIGWTKAKKKESEAGQMKAPTQQQLNDPKWWDENVHPEVERIYVGEHCLYEMKLIGEPKYLSDRGWSSFMGNTDARRYWNYGVSRPTKPELKEWDGEGLPPVGVECEYALKPSGPWFRCEIVSHNRMVIRCPHLETDSDRGLQIVGCNLVFRPLRTKEQREREVVVATALSHIPPGATSHDGVMLSVYTDRLYDAGMLRKAGD